MGTDKANLPFGSECLLQRMVRIVAEAVPPQHIAIVAARDQTLPPIAEQVIITHDRHPDRGPLEGLASGLVALPSNVNTVYLSGCDTPLLVGTWVETLFSLLGEHNIAVPQEEEHFHPLAAVYRNKLRPSIDAAITAGERALHRFIATQHAKAIPVEQLCTIDPELLSLRNINTNEEYQAALEVAGLDD